MCVFLEKKAFDMKWLCIDFPHVLPLGYYIEMGHGDGRLF